MQDTLITPYDTLPMFKPLKCLAVNTTTIKTKCSLLIEVMGLYALSHLINHVPFVGFPTFSSLEEEFPMRSARAPVRCCRELEDLRQQKCLKTDRRMDRPYCTAHSLLSACLSALPWGQSPNCWSWRNSVSLVGSHPHGLLFLAPSSNPCIILNKCLNSSSEHVRHPKPPSSAQPMWYRRICL